MKLLIFGRGYKCTSRHAKNSVLYCIAFVLWQSWGICIFDVYERSKSSLRQLAFFKGEQNRHADHLSSCERNLYDNEWSAEQVGLESLLV